MDLEYPVYWLHRDVYCTDVGDAIVFLDLRTDKYTALPDVPFEALSTTVANWPFAGDPTQTDKSREAAKPVVAALLSAGLLTENRSEANTASPPPKYDTYLGVADVLREPLRIRPNLAMKLVAACATARRLVFRRSIARLIQHLRSQADAMDPLTPATPSLLDTSILAHFLALRPFLYTAHNQCLLDSAVLSDFLCRQRIRSSFVIGVKTRPFAAHCWVQYDDVILNDTVEHVSNYHPILSV